MDKIEKLIQRVRKTQHGFLDIQKAANRVADEQPAEESLCIAGIIKLILKSSLLCQPTHSKKKGITQTLWSELCLREEP
jgi:hypothetical protein